MEVFSKFLNKKSSSWSISSGKSSLSYLIDSYLMWYVYNGTLENDVDSNLFLTWFNNCSLLNWGEELNVISLKWICIGHSGFCILLI